MEDTLRRTLILFQLLQDVTAAAGLARSVEEALQDSLDIICAFSGWPVAHVFLAQEAAGSLPQLRATGIWHLENPHDFESFLRSGEQKPLGLGRGPPGAGLVQPPGRLGPLHRGPEFRPTSSCGRWMWA